MNFDLTTTEGRKNAGKYLTPVVVGVGTALVILAYKRNPEKAQIKLATGLIKAGRRNGVDNMEIIVDNKIGMNFGTRLNGISVNATPNSDSKMTLKVQYKKTQ